MKLVKRMLRMCQAVLEANSGYFEESKKCERLDLHYLFVHCIVPSENFLCSNKLTIIVKYIKIKKTISMGTVIKIYTCNFMFHTMKTITRFYVTVREEITSTKQKLDCINANHKCKPKQYAKKTI